MALTMQQVWIERYGEPDVLRLREAAIPRPGRSEILIKVAAAGVNFADVLARVGIYPDAPKPPCVVGYEVAGLVEAVGSSVASFRVGDRILAPTHFGGYSSHICIPESQAFRLPSDLSFEEGAALCVTYMTAYQLVIAMGGAKPGDTILLHSAAGGVGLSVIDLANIVGARVIGVASLRKHEFLEKRGVAGAIDNQDPDIIASVMELTAGRGVDLAFDANGGKSWCESYRCLRPTGRLGVYGLARAVKRGGRWLPAIRTLAGVPWFRFNPITMMNDNRGIFGVNLRHIWDDFEPARIWMSKILEWQLEGKIKPIVDRSFPLADAALAHRYLQSRSNIGKVVLLP